jgi:hypothetical protein
VSGRCYIGRKETKEPGVCIEKETDVSKSPTEQCGEKIEVQTHASRTKSSDLGFFSSLFVGSFLYSFVSVFMGGRGRRGTQRNPRNQRTGGYRGERWLSSLVRTCATSCEHPS